MLDRFLSGGSCEVNEELRAYEVALVVVGLANPLGTPNLSTCSPLSVAEAYLLRQSAPGPPCSHSSPPMATTENKRFEEDADNGCAGVGISDDSWSFSCCSLSSIDNLD